MADLPKFDRMFHQAVAHAAGGAVVPGREQLSDLKATLAITDGNLDAHLRKLSAAGYLQSEMVVEGRPRTVYSLSPSGTEAFDDYLDALDELIEITRPAP